MSTNQSSVAPPYSEGVPIAPEIVDIWAGPDGPPWEGVMRVHYVPPPPPREAPDGEAPPPPPLKSKAEDNADVRRCRLTPPSG